jgi:hypothetical protein
VKGASIDFKYPAHGSGRIAMTFPQKYLEFVRRESQIIVVTLIAAVLLFYALDRHLFWADEAITAFYGRSIVQQGHGLPLAWDSRNLLAFGGGSSLDANMFPAAYPLLQFYLPAPFFAVFSPANQTFAGRLPFALLGLATVPLLYLLL